jgi:hypothetical protein
VISVLSSCAWVNDVRVVIATVLTSFSSFLALPASFFEFPPFAGGIFQIKRAVD